MEKKKLSVLCGQGSSWKGNRARELREGYKQFYSRMHEQGRNGVKIILSIDMKDSLFRVNRIESDEYQFGTRSDGIQCGVCLWLPTWLSR